MRHVLRLALTAATLALSAQLAHAQGVNIPPPGAVTYVYSDSDGQGTLTVTPLGVSTNIPAPGARQIQVRITQNGNQYTGSGISYPLAQTNSLTLLTFAVVDAVGRTYFFQGTLNPGFGVRGQGTYFAASFPEDTSPWSITGIAQ
jgi:hypothetical protein